MNKVKLVVFGIMFLFAATSNVKAEALLQPDDFVGFSFWFISMGCLAATAFFFLERNSVAQNYKTPITIAGVITGIAFIHYIFIRNIWVATGDVPIVYKYIEWFITMPLLTVQFYLILTSTRKISQIIFWKLLIAALIMVSGGYAGESGFILPFLGFIIWMVAWIYILYELFSGEAGTIVARASNEDLVWSFNVMRMIVTLGWMVYPLGYVFGYLTGGIDSNSLNVVYNFADFINKIAFGVVIWSFAKQS